MIDDVWDSDFVQVAPDVKEVLDTFRIAAELGTDSLGAYVISMASNVWFK